MTDIRVNGKAHSLSAPTTLQELLQHLGYQDQLVAVAVNKTCVKRSALAATQVAAGDDIEILAPMAGG